MFLSVVTVYICFFQLLLFIYVSFSCYFLYMFLSVVTVYICFFQLLLFIYVSFSCYCLYMFLSVVTVYICFSLHVFSAGSVAVERT